MTSKEVFDKAYGNIPKELEIVGYWDWIPTPRGVKYYYHKFIRFFTR
jgi:hypothetical protein